MSVKLNGHPERRLPNTLNVSLLDTGGEMLLTSIHGLAASTALLLQLAILVLFNPSKVR
jgi:cysteine sulfinate desulfinase/cysteine desulfurase-like protein